MKILGLLHRADGVLGYQQKDESYRAILKAPKGEIKNVFLYWDDPYNWRPGKDGVYQWNCDFKESPEKVESDQVTDYFSFTLKSKEERFKYFFVFEYKGKQIAYGEFGMREFKGTDEFKYHPFSFTWNYSSEGKYIGPKEWWNKTSWYQVFPDRFASDTIKLGKEGLGNMEKAGGNIRGIITKLDYIKDLGFNGVYLNPIFKAGSNHKYDTIDYKEIDADFGTMEDFEELVKELKARDMKIMLDGVFNHMGAKSPQWLDVLKNKENSKYKDWFIIWDMEKLTSPEGMTDLNFIGEEKTYSTFGNTPNMPRLNWANKEVSDFVCSIIEFWTKKGIDAWRMDVADEVSFDMWRKARKTILKNNPDGMLLGEVWYDALPFLHGDQFDTTMNYPFRLNGFHYFVKDEIDEKEFIEDSVNYKYRYAENINKGLFNLMGSHDTPRLFEEAGRDETKTRIALAWLLLSNGSVSFYYGDEINLSKTKGKDNREVFDWEFDKSDKTYNLVKDLMKIRNENIDIIKQDFTLSTVDKKIIITFESGKEISFDKHNGIIEVFGKKITA